MKKVTRSLEKRIITLYTESRLSSRSIAKELKLGKTAILRVLKRNNIKRRSRSDYSWEPWNKGKRGIYTEEALERNRKAHLGKKHSEETKKKMSESHKGQPSPKGFLGKTHSKEWKKGMRKLWQDKEFRERTVRAILKGNLKRPTSLEEQMIGIIKTYALPYKYVGDGAFFIGGKNPDFIDANGRKKLIEVGNTYHHQNDYTKKRSEHFARYGWKSHIFIMDKLDEKSILEELNNGKTKRILRF